MRLTPFMSTAMTALILAGAITSSALAQSTPPDVRDLVGARGAGGEAALQSRGYVAVGGETGEDRKWTYWWSERRGVCLSVATVNGRYDSIVSTPAADCRRGRPTTLPGPVGSPVAGSAGEDIRFERGASSATRRGALKGYETRTYYLDVRAGQSLAVSLQTSNRSGYFNITAPRATQALFNGSSSGLRYNGRAAVSGRYKIDVYLMRNAARRGETMRYTLDVGVRR